MSVCLNRNQLNKMIHTHSDTPKTGCEEQPLSSFTFQSPNFDLFIYCQIKSRTLTVSTQDFEIQLHMARKIYIEGIYIYIFHKKIKLCTKSLVLINADLV